MLPDRNISTGIIWVMWTSGEKLVWFHMSASLLCLHIAILNQWQGNRSNWSSLFYKLLLHKITVDWWHPYWRYRPLAVRAMPMEVDDNTLVVDPQTYHIGLFVFKLAECSQTSSTYTRKTVGRVKPGHQLVWSTNKAFEYCNCSKFEPEPWNDHCLTPICNIWYLLYKSCSYRIAATSCSLLSFVILHCYAAL
jgi:hypothetical protein